MVTNRGPHIILTTRDRELKDEKELYWVFMKVLAKRPNKRAINGFLCHAWGIKSWLLQCNLVQTRSNWVSKGVVNLRRLSRPNGISMRI